jgi:hypothetical protein
VKGTFAATFLVLAGTAYAQTSRGTVTGTVLDATTAIVRGARITLINEETGVQFKSIDSGASLTRKIPIRSMR